tara:strand:- start:196 stop:771 length:576 start_codon:yes stop_codon:yes gene_type:complete
MLTIIAAEDTDANIMSRALNFDARRFIAAALSATECVVVPSGDGTTEMISVEDMAPKLLEFGFQAAWERFLLERTPRVHKRLERADIAGDKEKVEYLLEGRRETGGEIDPEQAAFLKWFVGVTVTRFRYICNGPGCSRLRPEPAQSQPSGEHLLRCSGCLAAVYCGKDCQKSDWVASHKQSCTGAAAGTEK